MELTIAIITSVVALITAIVSSIFSYVSTKKSAKVEAMKGYLSFLRHKMTRLEALLDSTTKFISNTLQSKSNFEQNKDEFAKAVIDSFDNNKYIVRQYGYLFSFQKKEVQSILREAIEITRIMDSVKTNNMNVDDIDPNEFFHRMSSLDERIFMLLQEELRLTYNEFESLSLLKR